jgi:hypothetical protein
LRENAPHRERGRGCCGKSTRQQLPASDAAIARGEEGHAWFLFLFVIPGRAVRREPGIHNHRRRKNCATCEYGFRIAALRLPE